MGRASWVYQSRRFFLYNDLITLRDNKIIIELFSLRENEFGVIEGLITDVNKKYKLNSSILFKKELLVILEA